MIRQENILMPFAMPRLMAFAGCCIIAALNARLASIAWMVEQSGFFDTALSLFQVSVVVWFAFYAVWTIAQSEEEPIAPWRRGDVIVLSVLVLATLIPSSTTASIAGLSAGLWLLYQSRKGSATRRVAIILTAIAAQQIFGRVFMALFSEAILAADIFLVDIISELRGQGNILTRTDGSEMIVAGGCSSFNNMSFALLAWVTVTQLFKLRVNARLLSYMLLSLIVIFILNSVRLLMMGWYPEYMDFLHSGGGAATFGWAGFLMLAIVAGIAVTDLHRRGQMA